MCKKCEDGRVRIARFRVGLCMRNARIAGVLYVRIARITS
jgi:hypothetical protein